MTPERHVLGLSGGRDSAALAVYMHQEHPEIEMEYYFSDTGNELPEVYEFLSKMEGFLGKQIVRLNSGRDFDYWLKMFRYYLPSPQVRWCTRVMKIEPFLKWIKPSLEEGVSVINYVAIRADEPAREGLRSIENKLKVQFPFRENQIDKEDVINILKNSGIGLPAYYQWRSRSGCTFCFYQRKIEWVGLLERHPEEFKKAMEYEKLSREKGGRTFYWIPSESLEALSEPNRISAIKSQHTKRFEAWKKNRPTNPLRDDLCEEDLDELYGAGKSCVMCHK